MIEKYFQTGVRLKWMPNRDVIDKLDGEVVETPQMITNPMVYDGMDGELVGSFHASNLNLRMGAPIPFTWLPYAPGRTATAVLTPDLLTGPMSGCPIATWFDKGVAHVGHIGTIVGNTVVNRKVRHTFAAEMAGMTQLTGFSPSGAWTFGEISAKQAAFKVPLESRVYALVTAPGVFYSILMFQFGRDASNLMGYKRVVGGIKPVKAMTGVQLKAMLLA